MTITQWQCHDDNNDNVSQWQFQVVLPFQVSLLFEVSLPFEVSRLFQVSRPFQVSQYGSKSPCRRAGRLKSPCWESPGRLKSPWALPFQVSWPVSPDDYNSHKVQHMEQHWILTSCWVSDHDSERLWLRWPFTTYLDSDPSPQNAALRHKIWPSAKLRIQYCETLWNFFMSL
jgi:hypothetical protein